MNNEDIKKLAKFAFEQKKIEPRLGSFILEKLNRKQLATFVRYLKILIDKQKVVVRSGTLIPNTIKRDLERQFSDKNIEYIENDTSTIGISIQENDTIIDLSVSGMIDETVEKLKTNIW